MSPPARRWNDQAIDGLAETLRSLAPAVGQVASFEAELDLLKERITRFEDSRRVIVLGLLGFGATIAAALIGAAVTLIVHFT